MLALLRLLLTAVQTLSAKTKEKESEGKIPEVVVTAWILEDMEWKRLCIPDLIGMDDLTAWGSWHSMIYPIPDGYYEARIVLFYLLVLIEKRYV